MLATLIVSIVCQAEASKDVDAKSVMNIMSEVQVLDVRTIQEFKEGHIEGAINIDVTSESFAEKVDKLEKEKTYLVHCGANVENGRAAKAMAQMNSLGFSNLQNLKGGYVAWVKSGGEIVKAQ